MEEKKIQEIFDALKNEALTERERIFMRKELELLMKNNPPKVPLPIRVVDKISSIFDPGFFKPSASRKYAGVFASALVLFIGIGTSFAAGGALPGDVLYPVKIQVNEKFEGALAVSDVAKVQWSAEQTQRRLEEAEVLAAKGTLNDQNSSEITAQIDTAAQNFDQNVTALANSGNSEEVVADAQSNFDASLAAHGQLLAKIGDKIPHVRQAIDPILSAVRTRVHGDVAVARATSAKPTLMAAMNVSSTSDTSATSTKKSSGDKIAASHQKQRAEQKLKEVRDLTVSAKTSVGSSTLSYFHAEASTTAETISAGDKNADEGNYDQALQAYQDALRVSAEAKAGLNAEIRLRQSVNISNLDLDTSDSGSESEKGDPSSNSGDTNTDVPHL